MTKQKVCIHIYIFLFDEYSYRKQKRKKTHKKSKSCIPKKTIKIKQNEIAKVQKYLLLKWLTFENWT